ncbi:hypothetical protein PFISCL1PPCAC_20535 [Pristionchus fissidentatus]|uniref:Uncharacterized protein n=1 Tax=Pristionchus fissidentatus TaxID=1538716 RepID=A0AAV5WCH6_9BILA|nr:hypothetical protein PFISCL1PPCAC_20535 [Pristionchus fissidentatus]
MTNKRKNQKPPPVPKKSKKADPDPDDSDPSPNDPDPDFISCSNFFNIFFLLVFITATAGVVIDVYNFVYPVPEKVCSTVPAGLSPISRHDHIMLCKKAQTYNDALIMKYVKKSNKGVEKWKNDSEIEPADELYFSSLIGYQLTLTHYSNDRKQKDPTIHFFLSNYLSSIKCNRVDRSAKKTGYTLLFSFCTDAHFKDNAEKSKTGKTAMQMLNEAHRASFLYFLTTGDFRNVILEYMEANDPNGMASGLIQMMKRNKGGDEILRSLIQFDDKPLMAYLQSLAETFLRSFDAMTECDPLHGDTWVSYLHRSLFKSANSPGCLWNRREWYQSPLVQIDGLTKEYGLHAKIFFYLATFACSLLRFCCSPSNPDRAELFLHITLVVLAWGSSFVINESWTNIQSMLNVWRNPGNKKLMYSSL